MEKRAFTDRCRLLNRLSNNMETSFLITSDSTHIPCPHFQINRLSGIQLVSQFACFLAHLLTISLIAEVRIYAYSKEDLCLFFDQIDISNQSAFIHA